MKISSQTPKIFDLRRVSGDNRVIYTLKANKTPFSNQNRIEVEENISPFQKVDSNILSDVPKTSQNTSLESQQYNLSSIQKQANKLRRKLRKNGTNFITLRQVSEEEKIKIIQRRLKVYF